jgi:hypothetical protein
VQRPPVLLRLVARATQNVRLRTFQVARWTTPQPISTPS